MKAKNAYLIAGQAWLCLIALSLVSCTIKVDVDNEDLIPRRDLFSNVEKSSPQLSPDGSLLAYLSSENDYPAIWIKTVGKNDDRFLVDGGDDIIISFFWQPNGENILYQVRKVEDGSIWIFSVPAGGGSIIDYVPIPKIQARIVAVNPDQPNKLLFSMNPISPQIHDVYELDLTTRNSDIVVSNDIGAVSWIADHTMTVRLGLVPLRNGSVKLYHRKNADSEWEVEMEWGPEDALTTRPYAFAKDNQTIYMLSSVGSNTVELRSYNMETEETSVISSDPDYDLSGVMLDPNTYEVQATKFVRERAEWRIKDQSLKEHFESITGLQRGDFSVFDRDINGKIWVVSYISDDSPQTFYTYDTSTRTSSLLFRTNEKLKYRKLAQTEDLTMHTRDGKNMLCYLTRAQNSNDDIPPMMVYVHDGPWRRDTWGMDPFVQWLADRGYNVLRVNFRGSTGFGKEFQNAGDKEWGGAMQDDIEDAVNYLIEHKIAEHGRIGVIGFSYGGFAVLSALTKTPDLFACGVDLFGPANLISWVKTLPASLKGSLPMLHKRVGYMKEDREMMIERSPVSHFDQLMSPIMIVQGDKDERVLKKDTELIVNTLRANGRTVEYMGFPDEGHGFSRLENKLTCYANIEKFLAEHLGGRKESFSMTIKIENDDEE